MYIAYGMYYHSIKYTILATSVTRCCCLQPLLYYIDTFYKVANWILK